MSEPAFDRAAEFAQGLPFCRALGLAVDEVGKGCTAMSLPYDRRLVGDALTGVIHGGAVSSLLDTCGGVAVMVHPENRSKPATIDLRIDYMRSAVPGKRVCASAEVYHVTNTVAFVRGSAWDESRRDLVAAASGAFTFSRTAPNNPTELNPAAPISNLTASTGNHAIFSEVSTSPKLLQPVLEQIPFLDFKQIVFELRGDELTTIMKFHDHLIGNRSIPAIHGGAIAGFLESAAVVELVWTHQRQVLKRLSGSSSESVRLPRTIDFTVDYLRPARTHDCFARARVNRSGRRYASVHVEAWQGRRDRLFAQATIHFLNPQLHE